MSERIKQNILILGRGLRPAGVFSETARALSNRHNVMLTFGCYSEDELYIEHFKVVENAAKNIPNIQLVNLYEETIRHLKLIDNPSECVNEIEEKLDLPMYAAAANYLLYNRISQELVGSKSSYYKTEKEIVRHYVGSYYALKEIFENFKPDIILYETPDHIAFVQAMQMGRQRGIFALGFTRPTLIGQGRFLLTHGTNRHSPLLHSYYYNEELIPQLAWDEARDILEKYHQGHMPLFTHLQSKVGNFTQSKKDLILNKITQIDFYKKILSPFKAFKAYQEKVWLYKNMQQEEPQRDYILYFMHFQPEATTCSHAPLWVDQEKIIEQLSIFAPQGIDIIIREHPGNLGARGKRYFGNLLKLPNVKIQHPLYSRDALIAGAKAIVGISGSIGMEASLLGKPVAVLTRPFYAMMDGVHFINQPKDIFKLMKTPEWKKPISKEMSIKYLAALLASTFFVGDYEPGGVFPPPEVAGPNLAAGLEKNLFFIKDHKITPDMVDPGIFFDWSPPPDTIEKEILAA